MFTRRFVPVWHPPRFVCSNPTIRDKNKMVTRTIYCFLDCPALHSRPAAFRFATHQNRWSRLCLWQRRMADGEGFEPPDGLPHQRFSRPSHSTALPTILNFFFIATGLSNRRFWSAPNSIWSTSLRSQDRRIRPLCQPS